MEEIIAEGTQIDRRTTKINPEYQRITRKLKQLNDSYKTKPNRETLKEIRSLRMLRAKIPSRIGTGSRTKYVRYADD